MHFPVNNIHPRKELKDHKGNGLIASSCSPFLRIKKYYLTAERKGTALRCEDKEKEK